MSQRPVRPDVLERVGGFAADLGTPLCECLKYRVDRFGRSDSCQCQACTGGDETDLWAQCGDERPDCRLSYLHETLDRFIPISRSQTGDEQLDFAFPFGLDVLPDGPILGTGYSTTKLPRA